MGNFLWIFLLCSLMPLGCLCINCQFYSEYICGNVCLDQGSMCHCGNVTGSYQYFDGDHCCINGNEDACYKSKNGDVFCEEGTKQLWNEVCNDHCLPMASWGYDTIKCQRRNDCFLGVTMCRGQDFCDNDFSICSNKSAALDCGSQWVYEDCGLLENAKWVNYGCKHANHDVFAHDHFECANRMDKMDVIFKNPPVHLTPAWATAINYNQVLEFNETHIICGTHDFRYEDFYEVQLQNGKEKCELKDGRKVQLKGLWGDLTLDFSFEKSYKMEEFFGIKRHLRLIYRCNATHDFFQCDSHACIDPTRFCDGIVNCPNGEDELFESCQSNRTASGLVKCIKKDIFNFNVWIQGIKCNGVVECTFGEDEELCSLPNEVSLIIFTFVILVCLLTSYLYKIITMTYLVPIDKQQSMDEDDFKRLHRTDDLKEKMYQVQSCQDSNLANKMFLKVELEIHHNGQINETVCCIKNFLDSETVAHVLRELPQARKSYSAVWLMKVKKFIRYEELKKQLENMLILKMTLTAVSYMMDLVKDSLILVELSLSQGGITLLMTRSTLFIKGTFFYMLGSIILPLLLNAISLMVETVKDGYPRFATLIMAPILPIHLKLKEVALYHFSLNYKIPIKKLEETKYQVSKFVQGDLAIEAHLQIIISIVLLILANSETRTISGLKALFENETLFYLPNSLALTFSITWSLWSCISSHMKGVFKRRSYSNPKYFLSLLTYTSSSIALRVFSCILFLTPGLGLFNILRHLQGEMYPHYAPFHKKNHTDQFHFGNAPPIPWTQISRWTYIDYKKGYPPNQTLYTLFSGESYCLILMITLVINSILQMLFKRWTNPKVYSDFSTIDLVIHMIGCCLLPYPMQEWDEAKGSVTIHKLRKDLLLREMMASMMLNFVTNLFLLSPLIVLGINVFERHALLLYSIGAFPEEEQAFINIKLMIILGYSFITLLTIIQVVSYYLCNGRFHPFAMIIMPEPEHSKNDLFVRNGHTIIHQVVTSDC